MFLSTTFIGKFQHQAGAVTPLRQCLSSLHEVLDLIPTLHKPGIVIHSYIPSAWEIEAGGSELMGDPRALSQNK